MVPGKIYIDVRVWFQTEFRTDSKNFQAQINSKDVKDDF